MLTKEKEKYLAKIYFDPKEPASFSSLEKFYNAIKDRNLLDISKSDLRKWLSKQESYTAHRSLRQKFTHPRVISPYKNYMWDMDVAFYKDFGEDNQNYKYFLLITDILSHYVWTIPLKTLKGKEILGALKKIFSDVKPNIVRTDKGSEFTNKMVENLLKSNDIKHIKTSGELKANYAERAIKTVKMKIQKYFSQNQTHRWIDILDDVTDSYNNTINRTIKMTPNEALKTNDTILWNFQYAPKPKKKIKVTHLKKKKINKTSQSNPFRFKVNDRVKLSRIKYPFQKEYDEKWTNEIFTISQKYLNQGKAMYHVKDLLGEPITGGFFQPELQKVIIDDDTTYKIEKVIRKRKRNGRTEYLVKWWGWPSKFNSYVPESDLEIYKKK